MTSEGNVTSNIVIVSAQDDCSSGKSSNAARRGDNDSGSGKEARSAFIFKCEHCTLLHECLDCRAEMTT